MRKLASAGATGLVALGISSAQAEPVDLVLNWVAEGDHAPLYYAVDQGWYEDAGIDLTIEPGKGSAMAAQRVGAGAEPIGIAELGTAFTAIGQGADLVAVMALYANSPFTLYWDTSSGIAGPEDFVGRTLGNPPGDAARVMWPAFAQATGLPEGAVTFVNVAPAAKLSTLLAGQVDIISDFYYGHDIKVRELGDDLGFIRWSEVGINPYGNAFIVNRDYLEANPELVGAFVEVTQRAYAACLENAEPCIDALSREASGIDPAVAMDQWNRTKELMADETTTTVGLGHFDAERIAATYELVETYLDLQQSFDPQAAFTNEYLSEDVKMTPQ
jgi:NitT/TauT family transport system substrate-binding protein